MLLIGNIFLPRFGFCKRIAERNYHQTETVKIDTFRIIEKLDLAVRFSLFQI